VLLTRRALNRATLDRQLLLGRDSRAPLAAVTHLTGLQAQAPQAPYLGLWSRLAGFDPAEVSVLISERRLLRAPVLRSTVHVMTPEDFVIFRPLVQPLMERVLKTNFPLPGVELTEVARVAHDLTAEQPRTRPELARLLAARWPDADPKSLAQAATYLVPSVQVPPRGLWRRTGAPTWAAADAWVGADGAGLPRERAMERLVLRYLAAFGPATVNDVQLWSGVSRLREAAERLDLRHYRGENGADLLDLPEVELPDPDIPAPPRFLPEYDNLLLSHADRQRVIPHDHPVPLLPGNGAAAGFVLIDGDWNALWKLERDPATITITPFTSLDAATSDALTAEAASLGEFLCPGQATDVRILRPGDVAAG
jgi:Winged helix DNA-binding domain